MQMVMETKAGLEAGVIGSGHSIVASRLDAQRSIAGWASEQMGGLSYLMFIRKLVSSLCAAQPLSKSALTSGCARETDALRLCWLPARHGSDARQHCCGLLGGASPCQQGWPHAP